jgi:NADPH:quinone reductase-like Zn-dependent oxidoreductase
MEAYRIDCFGSVDGIVLRSSEDPRPGLKEIFMRVRASALNYRDLNEAIGAHRGHESDLCERGYGFDGVTRATANRADFGHTDSRHDLPRRNHLARSVRELRTTPA